MGKIKPLLNIFAILTILVTLLVLLKNYNKRVTKMSVRIAYPSKINLDNLSFDPQINLNTHQAFLSYVLYLRITKYDENGLIQPEAIDSYYLDGRKLHLKLSDKIKTSKGRLLTTKDLEYSIKRALILSKSPHGNLKQVICHSDQIVNLDDNCSGISVTGDELILTAVSETSANSLIPWLASIDFSIIPYDSIDINSPTLPIKDYSNTTGPFYIDKINTDGSVDLKPNISTGAFKYESYDVKLIPATTKNDLELLIKNSSIDIIPTLGLSETSANYLANIGKNQFIYRSTPLQANILKFTERGLSRLSLAERYYIGNCIQNFLKIKLSNEKDTSFSRQIFSPQSNLNLDENEKKYVENLYNSYAPTNKQITINTNSSIASEIEDYLKLHSIPNVKIFYKNNNALTDNSDNDASIGGFDTVHFDSFSGINYEISIGIHGYDNHFNESIINNYINSSTHDQKTKTLRTLHFNTLKNGYSIPLYIRPYYAIGFNNWVPDFIPYYAISQIWQIKQK